MVKIVFTDRIGRKYTKLFEPEYGKDSSLGRFISISGITDKDYSSEDLKLLVGKKCWITFERVQDNSGDVWPKICGIRFERG